MSASPTAGLRLAIYARVSTEEQREGQTIDSQISELEGFARQNGWQIVEVYKDEGWSGGLMERPELDRLRDSARKGLFQAALINDVDRLARDVTHLGVIKRDLERHNVRVIFRKLPSENSPTHNLMVNILGSFAEFERELIADRTRRGKRYKIEVRKQYLGSKTAYGFRYVTADQAAGKQGYLEIIPAEAAVVRQIYAWVDREALSARRVLVRLDERGIRPRNGGSGWAKSSVLRILRNEMYAGVWHYNKHQTYEPTGPSKSARYARRVKSSVRRRPKTEWLPLVLPESLTLVPRDQWDRVQRCLDRNITFSPRNEKHSYLLKGLVRCGGCGARYVGNPCHGKYYYRCLARCKKHPTIREEVLNETVWDAVKGAVLNPSLVIEQAKKLNESERTRRQTRRSESIHVEHERKQIDTEESRVLEAYRLGVTSPTHLGRELENLKVRRTTLESREKELNEEHSAGVAPQEIENAVRDYCGQAAQNLGSFTHADRQHFLRTLLREIVFEGSLVRIRGAIPVHQTWNSPTPDSGSATQAAMIRGGTETTSLSRRGRSPASRGSDRGTNPVNQVPGFPYQFDLTRPIVKKPPPLRPKDRLGRFVSAHPNR
jgi:site-specific DNA recombinase